jgi:hypothetical protein
MAAVAAVLADDVAHRIQKRAEIGAGHRQRLVNPPADGARGGGDQDRSGFQSVEVVGQEVHGSVGHGAKLLGSRGEFVGHEVAISYTRFAGCISSIL